MNSIIKSFQNAEVRFVDHPTGKYAFGVVAIDVAISLDYSKPNNFAELVDDEYKCTTPVKGEIGQAQSMTVLWEPGLYQGLSRTNKPNAKPFQQWLYEEVVPSIRKHGGYIDKSATTTQLEEMMSLIIEMKQEISDTKLLKYQVDKLEQKNSLLEGKNAQLESENFELETENMQLLENEAILEDACRRFPGLENALESVKNPQPDEESYTLADYCQSNNYTFLTHGQRIKVGKTVSEFCKLLKLRPLAKKLGRGTLYPESFNNLIGIAIAMHLNLLNR